MDNAESTDDRDCLLRAKAVNHGNVGPLVPAHMVLDLMRVFAEIDRYKREVG
jgi:hypothetical protein